MNLQKISDAVNLAQKVGYILVATSDTHGVPHVTAAAKIAADGNKIAITEWFCPGTIINLDKNRNISIVVWNNELNAGFQLVGKLEKVEDIGILDGIAPSVEMEQPIPQIEKQLSIKIDKIFDFRLGPHSDVEV